MTKDTRTHLIKIPLTVITVAIIILALLFLIVGISDASALTIVGAVVCGTPSVLWLFTTYSKKNRLGKERTSWSTGKRWPLSSPSL